VRLTVRLSPNAGANRVDGVVDGALRARVAARPVDGAANEALIALVAEDLGIARGRVSVVRGGRSRLKVLAVEGIDADLVRSRWPGLDV
jgi:uncharacterized protein